MGFQDVREWIEKLEQEMQQSKDPTEFKEF